MKGIESVLNESMVFQMENHLYCQHAWKDGSFEEIYLKLREHECRIYEKQALRNLPDVSPDSSYFHEWKIRSKSATKVATYFQNQQKVRNILEVGCGNGWLSNFISKRGSYNVVGLDVNVEELKQASQTFIDSQNVRFVYGNLFDEIFIRESFDIAVLAASIQYFKDVNRLVYRIFELLKKDGEIHILDSPIYKVGQLQAAKKRSLAYFTSHGHPEMENHYFHHSFEMLDKFNFEIMYDPSSIQNRILRKWFVKDLSPFPWIRIQRIMNDITTRMA